MRIRSIALLLSLSAFTASPAYAWNHGAIICGGHVLNGGDLSGGQAQWVQSSNGYYTLAIQQDCNFVYYHNWVYAGFESSTQGASCFVSMQEDGNLVLYIGTRTCFLGWCTNPHYAPFWSSNSGGHPGACLIAQDDGNMIVQDPQTGAVLWSIF